jgi:opacity protein-like surface antigen
MRKFFILCSAFFCLSLTASAQDSTAAFDAASPEAAPAAAPAPFIPPDRDPWQLNAGFAYIHYNVLGQKFSNYGYQAGVTRYFNDRFGVEGTAIAGFGHSGSNPSIDAKSLFIGGGAHVSLLNRSHYEVWGHVLGGWQHFRFTQGAILGSNSHIAFLAGGGLDYKIRQGRLYWRAQGDFLGANFGPFSYNYLIGTGLVLNF